MTEELSKLAGGVKGEVIKVLTKNYPLTAKQTFTHIKKELTQVTYQGVHKALKELLASEIIVSSKEGYSLNRVWLSGILQDVSAIISFQDSRDFPAFSPKKNRLSSAFGQ